MPRQRRKRKPLRTKSPQPQSAKAADDLAYEKAIALRLVKIFKFMNLLALFFAVISFIKLYVIEHIYGGWLYSCYPALAVLSVIVISLQKRVAPNNSVMKQVLIDPTEFRRRSTTFLALLIFINIVAAFPLLYTYGYVPRAANWIQSVMPGKLRLATIFTLGLRSL